MENQTIHLQVSLSHYEGVKKFFFVSSKAETLVVIVKQTHLQKCLLVCPVLLNLNWVNVALPGSVESPLVIYDDASDDDPYRDAKDVAFAQAYLEKARNAHKY